MSEGAQTPFTPSPISARAATALAASSAGASALLLMCVHAQLLWPGHCSCARAPQPSAAAARPPPAACRAAQEQGHAPPAREAARAVLRLRPAVASAPRAGAARSRGPRGAPALRPDGPAARFAAQGRVPRDRLVAALRTARSACAGRRPRVLKRGPGSAPTPAASAGRRPLILSEPTHGHQVRFNLRVRVRVRVSHEIWGFLNAI